MKKYQSQAIVFIVLLITILSFVFLNNRVGHVSNVPVGIVIPHHDLVAGQRLAYLRQVAKEYQPKTIIVLSPDHFGQNSFPIVASNGNFDTSVGVLLSDQNLIQQIDRPVRNEQFHNEHGVFTLLRDFKQSFPEAMIAPFMISSRASYDEVESFVNDLYANCPDCLLVASVDFSHTSEADVANLHDVYTERELQQADAEALYKGAEVDSGASLAVLALWAKLHKAERFETFSHTNSGYITGRQVGEMTTHIIGGYSIGEPVTNLNDTVTLQFGGDVMFARGVEETHLKKPKGALADTLGERFFWGTDASIVNLEGVFTNDVDYREAWNDYPPKLRFSPVFISALQEARISGVSMANNHSFDGGEEEYQATINQLQKNNITSLANRNGDDPSIQVVAEGETKVAIMTIATHGEFKDLALTIQEYSKQGYFVVVYAHWGNEYDSEHSPEQEAMAKRWIDAGAKLIVGSHPHVVQPVGVYKGVPIIYSLGNLLFDQTQSEAVQVGAVLGVKVSKEGQELFLAPVSSYLKPQALDKVFPEWLKAFEEYKNTDQEGNTYYFDHSN